MIGVCYLMLHEYDEAVEWLLQAEEGASDYERGSIERDMARAYQGLGEDELAEISIATSLDLLPYDRYPSAHAATLGFLARLQVARGELTEALATFADADRKLHAVGDRHSELYNKLDMASARSLARQPLRARWTALKALPLAVWYGSFRHVKRAAALLVGGHRLESYGRKRFPGR
jgi:tetratricopeptide (TPR) repeat protein